MAIREVFVAAAVVIQVALDSAEVVIQAVAMLEDQQPISPITTVAQCAVLICNTDKRLPDADAMVARLDNPIWQDKWAVCLAKVSDLSLIR